MPSQSFSGRLIAALVLAASLPVALSFAQGTQPTQRPVRPAPKQKVPESLPDQAPKQPTAPNAPAGPGTPAKTGPGSTPSTTGVKGVPEVGPYLTREAQRIWTLKAFVRLNSDRPDQFDQAPGVNPSGKQTLVPKITPFKATKVAVVFPGLDSTGSSECRTKNIKGTLMFDDQVVDDKTTVMSGGLYHSGVRLIRLESEPTPDKPEVTIRDVNIEYVIPVTCFSTKYDEAAAEQVPWPTGAWPVDAASTLTPQLFVDLAVGQGGVAEPYTEQASKVLQDEIDRALAFGGVKNPKDVTPARLAKLLTRQIWQDVQVSGTGKVARPRTGEFAGLDMQDPAQTLSEKRGDVHDITALTAAIFRKAGLPTRTVIGIDMYAEKGAAFLKEDKATRELRSWVEFAVYDEAKNTINWIPIDIPRMRRQTSRPTDINKPWKFFGSHDELNSVIPFAFQFHPPTDVVAYNAPGFWGWYVEPTAPKRALTAIRFDAQQASNRGDAEDDHNDKRDDKKDKDDKKKDAPRRRY